MAIATIRDMINAMSPPWLQKQVGGTILRAVGTVLDALIARNNEGVKLRLPGIAAPSALGYIGNDRDIERGPYQSSNAYALQLQQALDTWRHAGSPFAILPQLRFYFYPHDVPTMRAVSSNAVWHEIDNTTAEVTKTVIGDNWNWDDPDKWWWGWVIIDGTLYWSIDYWNLGGTWGDGGVWGSNMSASDARSLNRIVKKWMNEKNRAQIIVIFDTTLFKKENTVSENVDGTGEDMSWRAGILANFFEPQVNR